MKRVIVTGVGGFIGSNLARDLISDGIEVLGVDCFSTGSREAVPKECNLLEYDCSDPKLYQESLLTQCGDIDVIFHLAGQSSGEISFSDPIRDITDNCLSTLQLLDFSRKKGVPQFVYASSMSVYGSPTNRDQAVRESDICTPLSMYAVGKMASESYMRIFADEYGLNTHALRFFNVYGPGQNLKNMKQGMMSIYLQQALAKRTIVVRGSLDRFRDFVFIDDVVASLRAAALSARSGFDVTNVCTGKPTTVRDLVRCLSDLLPFAIDVEQQEGTPGDQFGIYGSTEKLKENLINQEFTDLRTGAERFISWAML